MSTRYLNRVWHGDLDLDHTEKLVLLSLADQANDEGWCWPSNAHTAQRCSLHRDTVFDIISRLETKGYIEVTRRPGRSSYFRIEVPEPTVEDRNHLRSRAVTPTVQDRNTYGPHSTGTIKKHQRTHDERVKLDIEQAKLQAVPMPDTIRNLIAK